MKKTKIFFLLAMLLFFLLGSYYLMRPYWRLSFDKLSPFEAISANTALVIGFDLAESNDSLLQDQLWALDVKRLNQLLDSLGMQKSSTWEEWWMMPKQLEQGGELAYTFIGNGKNDFSTLWKEATLGVPMNYGDGAVYGFRVDTEDPLYFARVHNLLIAGKYPFQIEEILSLLKTNNDSWQDNTVFETLKNTPKDKGFYRMIIHSNGLLSTIPDQWMTGIQKKILAKHLDWLWIELENIDSTAVLSAYLSLDAGIEQTTMPAADWQWVPEICQSAIPLHFHQPSSAAAWMEYMAPWIGEGGWELTLTGEQAESETMSEIWVLPIADSNLFKKRYSAMLAKVGVLDKIDYQRFQLRQLQSSPIFSPLSDRKGLQMWLCELDGVLLCAVFREDMERWLDYYMVGGQIEKEIDFLMQQQAVGHKKQSQLLWRWNPLADLETNLFKLFYPRASWADAGQLLVNIAADKSDFLSLRGSIQTYKPRFTGPSIAWTLPLQMEGDIRLLPVRDIHNEQTIALAVQDETGHFIFLDKNANILWEKEAVAPVLGKLYAIPWYNGTMRLLAATVEDLQLWDENGERIDQFPAMPAPPSSGIHIAHFGQKDQLGIFIPTTNGQVWGFTPEGELLPGWPVKAYESDTIISALLHYQTPVKDLLISWSDSLGWKVFDKQGLPYFDVQKLAATTISPPFGQQLSDDATPLNNRLVMAYDNGVAQVVSFTGETFSLPLGRGPADHFLFSPVWGDERADYIVQRGQLIHLFAYQGNVFSERWQAYFTTAPDTIIDLSPYGLISMNNDKKEIYLLDGNGQLMSEFPLAGQQNAFLLNTSAQEHLLLTLVDKELYAYRLNW